MADVQFSEDTVTHQVTNRKQKGSMMGWLVRSGWAKDEKSAGYLLMAVAGVGFVTTAAVLMFGSPTRQQVPLNPLEQTIIPGPGGVPSGYAQ